MFNKESFLREKIITETIVTANQQQIDLDSESPTHWLIDFRKILLTPEILNIYTELFFEKYKDQYPFQVCGLEVAAVPLVSAIVMKSVEMKMPVNSFFIRKSRKKSGLLNMVEGRISDEKIILVDDIINTGSSFIRQIEVLEKIKEENKGTATLQKINISNVFSIMRFRNLDYYTYFHNKNILVENIFELDDITNEVNEKNVNLQIKNLIKNEEKSIPNNFEIKWALKIPGANYFYVVPKSAPLYFDNKIYFGTDSGNFICLNSDNGEEIWRYRVPFGSQKKLIFSSPCLVNNKYICFGAYDGNLYLLDKETGKRVWVFMEADWIGSSPCYSKDLDLVFIGMEYGLFKKQGGLTAVKAETGEKKWEYRSESLTHGSPAYSRKYGIVACGSNDKFMHILNAKTGKLIWKFETQSEIKYAPCIDEKRGLIIFGGIGGDAEDEDKSKIYVCDIKTGKIKYTYNELYFGVYSSPVVYKNIVIISSLDKCIHAFNIENGKQIWKYNTGARIFSTPVIINSKLYIGQNSSRFYEINPETGEVLSISHFTERITNGIAYDESADTIFVPTFANEIYALKRKK
ncbi:PQQ-binding-like beta-propeller repeat protein [Candidatus Gracilibacteria bacterium]|nr:PQQ-binding-like beta-propeller repeat protein [Candidatus Gracilibacteria bacterium]MCF7898979.1 PQQ-binding-like beta-propeller repeat protein [Candidatus Paceibacterota bacterium]